MEELCSWEFSDTKQVADGYDMKIVPEATSTNMVVLMDKINELVQVVNSLKGDN